MKSIGVFCSSNLGVRSEYAAFTKELANALVKRGVSLVYGGASVGLMGLLADSVLALGGQVVGVIPESLVQKEVSHPSLSKLHVVSTMHERKALIAELSDGFIALPGGFGTLDELCEMLTWAQLGFHRKPIGLLNVCGYFQAFLQFLRSGVQEGFIREGHRSLLIEENQPETLLEAMEKYQPVSINKWTGEETNSF